MSDVYLIFRLSRPSFLFKLSHASMGLVMGTIEKRVKQSPVIFTIAFLQRTFYLDHECLHSEDASFVIMPLLNTNHKTILGLTDYKTIYQRDHFKEVHFGSMFREEYDNSVVIQRVK